MGSSLYSTKTHEKILEIKKNINSVECKNERFMLVLLAKVTTFYKYVKRLKRCEWGARTTNVFGVSSFVVFSTICKGRNQNIAML